MESRSGDSRSTEAGGAGLRQQVEFAGFRLDPARRQLMTTEGAGVALTSRAFDTLLALVARRGEILSKHELLEIVWPKVVVEENNLNQAISALRKALGDSQDKHRIILTVPGRGYCFVAEVTPVGETARVDTAASGIAAGAAAPAIATTPSPVPASVAAAVANKRQNRLLFTAAAVLLAGVVGWSVLKPAPQPALDTDAESPLVFEPLTGIKVPPPDTASGQLPYSVAVLPFRYTDPDQSRAWLALGLYNDILNELDKVSKLKVIGPDTMMRYQGSELTLADIADEVSAISVIEGEVRAAGKLVRIDLHMTDPLAGRVLWSATYDADLQNTQQLYAIQGDITTKVAQVLGVTLQPQELRQVGKVFTTSAAAFQTRLQAGAAMAQGDNSYALDLLARAVALDPAYVEAWSELSIINTLKTALPLTSPEDHYEQGVWAAQQALQLDPMEPGSHVAMAFAMFNAGNWDQASAEYKQARQLGARLDSSSIHALFLLSRGDFATARTVLKQSLETDPANYFSRGFLMLAEELLGNREASLREQDLRDSLFPDWRGDYIDLSLAVGRDDRAYLAGAALTLPDYGLIDVLKKLDTPELAVAELQRLHTDIEQVVPGKLLQAAMYAAYFGHQDMALDFLRVGLRENWLRTYLLWMPVFDDMRRTDAFKQFLLESGIVDFWQAAGWPRMCSPQGNDDFSCTWQAFPPQ